ncbi:RDD family protein [Aliivibrio fischeri]|uniref:RDD family protein n=1 Tax=Aliivibrio fischeri TaxID=668 RepID=UPI0012DA6562|nr:RDD family protein [Aliivibrio fischeri]MUK94761.1 RDD family protein [Aliivibrio fischeri]
MNINNNLIIGTQKFANVGLRCLGQTIDGVISAIIFILILWLTPYIGIDKEISSLIALSVAAFYFLFSDGLPKGQSLGKKLLGISVIDSITGKYCSFYQSFLRNFLTPVIGIFDLIFIFGKKRQRFGDKLAKTIVILN